MSYERELAFNLRLRGVPETRVAAAIEEVRAHAASADTSAEAEFGTAEEYAASFPEGKRRSRGRRVIAVAVLLATAYVLAALVLTPLIGFDVKDITGPLMLWPAGVLVAAGLVGGFLTDYLRQTPRTPRR